MSGHMANAISEMERRSRGIELACENGPSQGIPRYKLACIKGMFFVWPYGGRHQRDGAAKPRNRAGM